MFSNVCIFKLRFIYNAETSSIANQELIRPLFKIIIIEKIRSLELNFIPLSLRVDSSYTFLLIN